MITCGAQHAIDLVARVLLEPGDCVAVEDPGYVPAVRLFGALGARVVGVPVDDQGLVVDLLPPSARIVYVTPSHQYPLGMTMLMPRRRALLRWAERHDAAIIEDDYDTEFRYVDRPLEPLQALDADGRVVYVGSFSKNVLPVGPPRLRRGASAAGRADRRAEAAHRLASADRDADRPGRLHRRWPARQAHPAQQARLRRAPPHPHRGALRAAGRPPHKPAPPTPDCTSPPCCGKGSARRRCCGPRPGTASSHPACTTASTQPSAIRPPDRIRRSQQHRPAGSTAHAGPRSRLLNVP